MYVYLYAAIYRITTEPTLQRTFDTIILVGQ